MEYSCLTSMQGLISSARCLAVSKSNHTRSNNSDVTSRLLFAAGGRAHIKAWRICYRLKDDTICEVTDNECTVNDVLEGDLDSLSKAIKKENYPSPHTKRTEDTNSDRESTEVKSCLNTSDTVVKNLSTEENNTARSHETNELICDSKSSTESKEASLNRESKPSSLCLPVVCWSEYLSTHMLHYKGLKRSKPWKKATYNTNPETRFMQLCAFNVQELDSRYPARINIVGAACSDGFVRLFSFDEIKKEFTLISQLDYHDHCVLCVKSIILTNQHHSPDSTNQKTVLLMSSATDGKVAFWDIRDVVKGFCETLMETIVKGEESSEREDALCSSFNMTELTTPSFVIHAHQSGVNAMDILETSKQICDSSLGRGNRLILATGGDDNALSIWCVNCPTSDSSDWSMTSHVTKTDAHGTQITGVKFLSDGSLLSSSIDQRLSIWKYNTEEEKITLDHCHFFDVADASDLDVWRNEQGFYKAAVSGMGLQTFHIQGIDPGLF